MICQAVLNGTVLAESDDIVTVEGNAYFPLEALQKEYFQDSDTTTVCPWKGTAHYLTVPLTVASTGTQRGPIPIHRLRRRRSGPGWHSGGASRYTRSCDLPSNHPGTRAGVADCLRRGRRRSPAAGQGPTRSALAVP